jgi:DNA-binding GntR family transcriptional regulator
MPLQRVPATTPTAARNLRRRSTDVDNLACHYLEMLDSQDKIAKCVDRISVHGMEANGTIADLLFDQLSEAIIGGEFAPGSKISEPQLAHRYGTSRAPLREAIRRLQERKLVTSSPNQGARVAVISAAALAELFAVREALEGLAAREAALHITPDEASELRHMLEEHGRALQRPDAVMYRQEKANSDFHVLIARAGRNELLFDLLCRDYYLLLRFYRMQHRVVPGRAQKALLEHIRIAEAIIDRDPELAELLMRRHVGAARAGLTAELARDPPDQGPGVHRNRKDPSGPEASGQASGRRDADGSRTKRKTRKDAR